MANDTNTAAQINARSNLTLGSSEVPSSSSKSLCRYSAKARQAFANPSMKTPQVTRVTLKGRLLRGPCRWAPTISGELYAKAIVIASGARGRKGYLLPLSQLAKSPGCLIISEHFGVWRRLVARSVRVGEVIGSNPVTPTRQRPYRHQTGTAYFIKFFRYGISLHKFCSSRSGYR